MKSIKLLLALSFFALQLNAQNTYTEKLRQNEVGKGTVIINQSPEIEQVVNGKATKKVAKDNKAVTLPMTGGKPVVTTHPQSANNTTNKAGNTKAESTTKTNETTRHASTATSHPTAAANNANGKNEKSKTQNTNRTTTSRTDTYHPYVNRARHKVRGYRICIFTGGNSRADKQKALDMGNKCRAKFPELASYASFEAPRWVTHVGDFKTREEAQKYVSRIRRAHITYEVRIVASEVNVPY